MSISVKHLNADTTFLITLSPSPERQGKDFTILVDPWLAGSSSIWTPRFQISHHTSDPIIGSLAHIATPDIILISQDKPDHCHEETLRTLPADALIHIVAVPAAAKKIRSWRYFINATITVVQPYRTRSPETVLRIPIATKNSPCDVPGEVTIAYIPQNFDMTNLHNAIGITYQTAGPATPDEDRGTTTAFPLSPPVTPVVSQRSSGSSCTPITMKAKTRPLSILYSPHGIGIPCVTPYMDTFLAPMGALPLTLLFHAINIEQNPWFLGGLVATGLPGGIEIVKRFGAKYWLSAHDEVKDNKGWATMMIKSRAYTLEEAQILCDDEVGDWEEVQGKAGPGFGPKLVSLDVGDELRV